MSSLLARVFNQQQLGYVPHTSVSGETWQFIKNGVTTSAGSAGGTTLVDTGGDSGGADTYNGRYWVELRSGSLKGQWRRIVDDDGSGTLTFENNGFSAQVGSGADYAIWLSPEPVVVIDSSGGETDAVDAVRAEADDFWIGYYLVPITGTHRGKIAQITDFTSSTGTFVLAASFGSALSAGDVCLLRKFVDFSNPQNGLTQSYIARPGTRVNFAKGDGTVGPRSGSFGFNSQVRPSGSLAGDTNEANASECSGLFEACGLEEVIGTTTTAGSGSTTSAIKIATGTWENFSVGAMVIWNGNATFIDSMEDGAGAEDTLNVTPALPTAPASSDVIYASRMYKKSTDGDTYGAVLEWEIDGVRYTMTGCKGSVSLVDGEVPEFSWSFSVDHWIKQIEAAPYNAVDAYPTAAPVLSSERLAYLSDTQVNISVFTVNPAPTNSPKNISGAFGVNGRSGFQLTNYNVTATYRSLLDSSGEDLPEHERFTARTSKELEIIYGSHSGTFAVRLPTARLIENPNEEDQDGLVGVPNMLEAQDAGTSTDGDSSIQKIPDVAFHLS